MKTLVFAVLMVSVAVSVRAESLGAAAKREKERRDKQKETSGETKTTVIDEAELKRRAEEGGKGTYNSADSSSSTSTSSSSKRRSETSTPTSSSSSSAPVDAPPLVGESDREYGAAARDRENEYKLERLNSLYGSIAGKAASFVADAREFFQACPQGTQGLRCSQMAHSVGTQAISIADDMEKAEETARKMGLNPGDVRAARERYGMDDAYWDNLVRSVNRFRAGQR